MNSIMNNKLFLEPICDTQDHIFIKKKKYNYCEKCYQISTDYKCKNCYHKLCKRCYTDEVIQQDKVRKKQDLLLKEIRERDIQMNNLYKKRNIIHRNDRVVIGRRVHNSPPRGLRSVLGFFKI